MASVTLSGGQIALVDDEDFSLVSRYKWHIDGNGYAIAHTPMVGGKRSGVLMHRLIMKPPTGMVVDHIHHNKLDNRKNSLRVCTRAQNHGNRVKQKGTLSKFKGVYFRKERGKWQAQISLGAFDSEEEAARAYDDAAKRVFGEFALTNF